MVEARNNWESRTVNGVYPLRRFLGSSDHSSVYLTESAVEGFLNAAIKIVPVTAPENSAVQLWHWKTAATFSHPHLIRLLDSGQCEIDGYQLLFVVMEYAEESLSVILPYRALVAEEVRELLVPTLDALAFLHRENWVQGQLKPSNLLVVNDQLKLATDTIRPVAVSRVGLERPSIYEPPESDDGDVSAAGDIWALGVTMVEALTQYPPNWINGREAEPSIPPNLPPSLADTVQRCLSRNPADRPTVAELQVQMQPGAVAPQPAAPPRAAAPAVSASHAGLEQAALEDPAGRPEPAIRAEPRSFPDPAQQSRRGMLVPAVIALLVVAVAIWGGTRLLRGHATPDRTTAQLGVPAAAITPAPDPQPLTTQSATSPSAPESSSTAPPSTASDVESRGTAPDSRAARIPTDSAAPRTTPDGSLPRGKSSQVKTPPRTAGNREESGDASGAVVHQEIPVVSPSARKTIHGHVRVGVRVTIDSSGRVVRQNLDNPGPSRYFDRLASDAAKKWQFAAATDRASRECMLKFEFGRDGTTVHAVGPRSLFD